MYTLIFGGLDTEQPDWRAWDEDDYISDDDDPAPISDRIFIDLLGFTPDDLFGEEPCLTNDADSVLES
jgi:hypothetical protein